ncbi:FtsX-like permease family protein [Actinoplanes oblitus]|uniref:FtsX-like permease family protein n=1 Tax=Actinoplanes oblitus TaxID=3040509 RepID=A0ABY8W7V3_9ACTN|nr:FtsX-like permease family protein [Actinoplanes oblitus]WIM92474.1 FtsX-like permease family protein [Actinoplanes oblitus]
MLIVTLSSLRTRWSTLAGTFVALALGVALLVTMGLGLAATLDAPRQPPERFAGAPVVVRGADELRVPSRIGDRVQRLARPRAVPAAVAERLATVGRTVADRSFPVAGGLVGHPWSVAGFGGYRLVAGREPRGPAEVVMVGAPELAGQSVRLRTPVGYDEYTVAGVLGAVPYEKAVFFSDDTAARIAPRIDNLVVAAAPEAVRAAAGDAGVRVLTGDERRRADPDPDRDRDALVAMNALLGTAGGVTAFVSVFVVASTFAFAVAQRRREIALLRTAGATPRQVRRTVLAEAAVAGVLASAAGCALGARGAPLLARVLVEERLAPGWFAIGEQRWPYHVAFGTGLVVALAGVAVATVRAGRVRPVEALREASADTGAMPLSRWICGAGLLATGLGLLCWRLLGDPGEALHRKTYTTQPMLLITAVALLAPALAGPLTGLVVRLPGVTGMLVRANARAGARRTAAVAAPVLVTVALAGSLLGTPATIARAKAAELAGQTTADVIVTGSGLDTVTAPGARVMASAATTVYTLEDGVALIRADAQAVDPRTLSAVRRLPVVAGSLDDLDDDGIVVNEEWAEHRVGRRVGVWLADGTSRSLRVVAVLAAGTGDNGVYVTTRNAGGAAPGRLDLVWPAGTHAGPVVPPGARVWTREQWLAGQRPVGSRQTRAGYAVVLGIALVYTGIAVANTMLMAAAGRTRDRRLLRLAGASRRQVRLVVIAEAVAVVLVGGLLGLLVTAVNLLGVAGALVRLGAGAVVVVPWRALGSTLLACAAVAVVAAAWSGRGRTRGGTATGSPD